MANATFKLSPSAETNGTFLYTEVDLIPSQVVAVLGNHHGEGDQYKITRQWYFTKGKKVFTLYDWKNTNWYDDKSAWSPEEQWCSDEPMTLHIGSGGKATKEDAKELAEWLKEKCNATTPSAHTPAPWKVIKQIPSQEDWIFAEGNKVICSIGIESEQSPKRNEANAHLVAAAPELLELAKQYVSDCQVRIEILEEQYDDCPCDDIQDQIDHWQATRKIAQKSIAKAERE